MYGQTLLRADWRLGCLGLTKSRGLHDRFGFGGTRVVVGQRKSPYSILGLQENAPLEEVKSAYKNMALKYHPDRLQNVPKYEEKRAKEKFHEIQDAYENIMDRHKLPKMNETAASTRRSNAHTDKMYKKYRDHTDHADFKDYAHYKQDTNKSNYDGKTAGTMPTSSDASMYTIIFTSMFLFYNIHLFTTIKKFSDPSRDLTTSETLTAMRLHFGGDSKYSWHQINKNRSTNRITSQLGKEETIQKIEQPQEPKNVEFLGQKIDPIEKSIGESRGEENSPRFMNGNKPVRYHKHHLSNQQVLYMTDYRTGQIRNDREIRELYENTDPILPVEVVIPMIMDPETGEWRKKTMHERYNKNRQVDRSREQYLRKKSEKESKKAPKESKQLSDMSLEELEKEAKKTKSKTERSLIE